jgi:hypothetical protein
VNATHLIMTDPARKVAHALTYLTGTEVYEWKRCYAFSTLYAHSLTHLLLAPVFALLPSICLPFRPVFRVPTVPLRLCSPYGYSSPFVYGLFAFCTIPARVSRFSRVATGI